MLFLVKNGFCQDDWKLNFSYQILKSTLTSESSFILTKYITWLPTRKPCDMSACPRTPAWSSITTAVLSNVLKTSIVPLPWPLLVALLECLESSSLSCQCSICLFQTTVRKAVSGACHGNTLTSSSSPEVDFGAQAFCAELNPNVLYPFCWTSLSSPRVRN